MAKQAPVGLGPEAKKVWKEVISSFELRADEVRILEDACREIDLIERMEKALGTESLIVKGSMGQPAPNPLIPELRQHRATFKTLIQSLKLPEEDESPKSRSTSARAAANARWRVRGAS